MRLEGVSFGSRRQADMPRARARYLVQSIKLEESGPVNTISGALFASGALVLAMIGWASITHVAEVARAPGEVIPAGMIHDVQHLEGGIVREIRVRNGDRVEKDELLLSLAPASIQAQLDQMRVRRAGLAMQVERLRAVGSGSPGLDLGDYGKQFPNLAVAERTIFEAQQASHREELAVVDAQIRQKAEELRRQRNRLASLARQVVLFKEQVNIRTQLAQQKLVARTELLATQSSLAQVESERLGTQDGIAVAESALEESKRRRSEVLARFDRDIDLEAGHVARQLAEVEQDIVRLTDRVKRLEVRAPVGGIVQGLSVTSANAVIDAGQVIMQVVPVNDDLVVEARISPQDIGHVHAGQPAEIKVDSYDASRFGKASGVVDRISPSTFLDERGSPYYLAQIALARPHLGDRPDRFQIIPGMTVEADIQTGDKTIMEYLMKPVSRGFDSAFGER